MWRALLLVVALPASGEPIAGTVSVIDGDTLDVGSTRVRLHGIDAAEEDQTCRLEGFEWPCGTFVSRRVRELFEGREAVCERLDTDRYGRAVARCAVARFAEAKEAGQRVDIGAEIVGRGLATAYRRYSDDYAATEAAARAQGAGLFAGSMAPPALHRAGAAGRAPPDPACPIKGNVSEHGRIFHLPEGAFYGRTAIDAGAGERWFCTPDEAAAAGWRPSQR
jgi:endonuclease YncB( thermonuclease family)